MLIRHRTGRIIIRKLVLKVNIMLIANNHNMGPLHSKCNLDIRRRRIEVDIKGIIIIHLIVDFPGLDRLHTEPHHSQPEGEVDISRIFSGQLKARTTRASKVRSRVARQRTLPEMTAKTTRSDLPRIFK